MTRFHFALIATPLLLAGCHATHVDRSIDLVVDVDESAHSATLTCRASSTDTCNVAYILGRGDAKEAQAAVGAKTVTDGIVLPAHYCVAETLPDPASCKPRPLSAGEQIVRMRETHSG